MELAQARRILSTLADGVNPMTGELLADSDSCNQAPVVRALYAVLNALPKEVSPSNPPKHENAGKPWVSEEDEQLVSEYQSGLSGIEIASVHKRSKSAIAARLVRLGLINERSELR